ncbi:hypothetical protein [Streptomyces aureoversilis]|uniref:Uncharacterized protein n=1 Tax=Streptomyces aureoversilis TaxID=67277 RepID=A0ABW0A3F3_9ACTN
MPQPAADHDHDHDHDGNAVPRFDRVPHALRGLLVQTWVELGQPGIADHYVVLERASGNETVFYPVEWHLREGYRQH